MWSTFHPRRARDSSTSRSRSRFAAQFRRYLNRYRYLAEVCVKGRAEGEIHLPPHRRWWDQPISVEPGAHP